jgi:hypothetical protein
VEELSDPLGIVQVFSDHCAQQPVRLANPAFNVIDAALGVLVRSAHTDKCAAGGVGDSILCDRIRAG